MGKKYRAGWVFVCPFLFVLGGCAFWQQKEPTEDPDQPRYIGRVSTINAEAHFVIIDLSGFQAPREGSDLETRSEGESTGTLRLGKEVRRPFAVADIVSGKPEVGDGVWLLKIIPEPLAPPPAI